VTRKPVQILGSDYWVNLAVATGHVPAGTVNIVVELYDGNEPEPVFVKQRGI
jgi:hypothetical protein